MSLNIKHKRSSVNGSAPTPAQLEDGELAVNYNDADPALYLKDSAGAVIRIAGVGAAGGGAPPSATPPATPAPGDQWLDTSVTPPEFKFYDGTSWVSTGHWDRTGTELSPKTAGDDLFTSGDVKVGGTTGTPNISLNANGNVTARGVIKAEQNPLAAGGNGFYATAAGANIDSNAAYLQLHSNGSLWATTGAEGIYIGKADRSARWLRIDSSLFVFGGTIPSAPNIKLNGSNGSAEFAGDLLVPNSINTSTSNDGVHVYANGQIYASRSGTNGLWTGKQTAVNGYTSRINADGSAEFAGSVSIGGTAAANTIDVYEKGDWTPVINGANAAYTTQSGKYVRIGNQVTAHGLLQWTTNDATTSFTLDGLPFATIGDYISQVGSVRFASLLSGSPADILYPSIETFSSSLYVRYIKTNGDTETSWPLAQDCNGRLQFNITYIIP